MVCGAACTASHVEPGPDLARHARGALHVVEGAEQVARGAEAHEPGALRQELLELLEVELEGLGIEGQPLDLEPEVARHQDPRVHVPIMVHPRQDHLSVPREVPADGARHVQREARHVLAEHDLVRGRRVEEVRHRLARLRDHRLGFPRGAKDAAEVGVALRQVARHSVHHRLWDLGAAGVVEVDAGRFAVAERQGRETAADCGEIEAHGLFPRVARGKAVQTTIRS